MATTSTSTAASSGGVRGGRAASNRSREGSAKAMVADQMSQAVQSTSNLLHVMHQSSPSQALLMKLPRNLLAKISTIKNNEMMFEHWMHIWIMHCKMFLI